MTRAPDKSGRQDIPPSYPTDLETSSLKAVLEHSDDAIFCKTLGNIVTLWSRGAERIYGYSSEEMVGESIDCLLPSDRRDETTALIARVAAGEHIEHFETLRITRSGVHDSGAAEPHSAAGRSGTDYRRRDDCARTRRP